MEHSFKVNRFIKNFILQNDKKPSAIADKAGIRRDTFSRIINEKRPVYADEVIPLCQALGTTVADMFSLDNHKSA